MVYVLDQNGQPLMPTMRYGKVRRLLKSGLAKVIKKCPFTIKLGYESTTYIQKVSLGIDAGSKHIGVSATTIDRVLYESDVELRNDIVDLLSTRREARRARRNRKTRYRAPRFLNRTRSKHKGWLAPSVENKICTHLTVVRKVCEILPIANIIVEVAAFDTQLLKTKEHGLPPPEGVDYQQGEQLYCYNVREYVFFRDGHKCRCCSGKSKDKILEVHHIQSRKVGGNAPNNLVTLCKTCHKGYHKGTVKLPESINRGNRYNDAAFMGIMRWEFYNRLKALYGDMVHMTFGYITKNTRINHNLPKEHYIDARCISGNPNAMPNGEVFFQKKIRCHNRQIHKFSICKGGIRKRNQADYKFKGFRLFDKVSANNKDWYIHGRRAKGSFVLKTLAGEILEIVPTKIAFLYTQSGFLNERRMVAPPTTQR